MKIVQSVINLLQEELSTLKAKLRRSYRDYYLLTKKTNHNLKEVFDTSNDLITIFSPTGLFRFVNKAWKDKLGYDEVDLLDLKFVDVVHPDYKKETLESLMKITVGGEFERFQTTLIAKNGQTIFVNGKLTCGFEDDRPVEFRCVFFDITERVRAEGAQALYYKIANLTITSGNLESLYKNIHDQLGQMLRVRNFSIAFKKPRSRNFDFAFWINENDESEVQRDVETLLCSYTLDRGTPSMIYQDGIQKIADQKKIKIVDSLPKVWLGVTIKIEGKPSGVLSVFSYRETSDYNNKDLELIDFVAGQVTLAMEREISEETIENQAARLTAIFESSTHQIWSVDRENRFTSFNQNYADDFFSYYKIPPQIGQSIEDFRNENFSTEMIHFWKGKYAEAFSGRVVNFQSSQLDSKKQPVWRNIFLNPIFLADGKIEEVSVIANDISEKKISEVSLQESEEKFRTIFESFQDIYFRCSLDGKITMLSPSAQKVLGRPPKQILGESIENFFFTQSSLQEVFKQVIKDGQVSNFEASAVAKSKKEIPVLCNIRLITKDDRPSEIEGVARDITQLKEFNEELIHAKELAEKSLTVKEQFLANMSHEIRTPMNGIVGMIDLIESTELNEEQSDYLQTIKRSSETLLTIVNDILDLSKIEAGKMELKRAPVQMVKTFEKIYDLYSQQAHLGGISFFYHLDKKLPDWVLIDETRLIQVLSNLTSNAIKFSQQGGTINLSIRVQDLTKKNCTFKVSVKDSGIGISVEDEGRLFQSFNQLDSSSSKNYGGTGLGLSISKQLVEELGGEIGVVSTPGLGSTFWFTFQAAMTDAPPKSTETEYRPAHKAKVKNPKILLVDDNQINRNVASKILTKSGCVITEASGGQMAIDLVNKSTYDLIFMDIQMPEMDGIEATYRLKSLELDDLPPIIAMTAYSMEEDREKFLGQGMDDYLPKPIKGEKLIQTIKKWTHYEPVRVNSNLPSDKTERLIVNQNTLNQLRKFGGLKMIEETLTEFDEEATMLVSSALANAIDKEYNELKGHMHTLKGNAGTLGVERLADLAAKVEKSIKENIFEDVESLLNQLQKELELFKSSYKKILESQ